MTKFSQYDDFFKYNMLGTSLQLQQTVCRQTTQHMEHGTWNMEHSSKPIFKHDVLVRRTYTGDGKYCLVAGQDRTVRLYNPHRSDPEKEGTGKPGELEQGLLVKTYAGPHG